MQNIIIPFLNIIFINQSDSAGEDTNRKKQDDNAVVARKNNSKENEKQINARNESDIVNESDHQEEANPIKQNDGKAEPIPGIINQFYTKN